MPISASALVLSAFEREAGIHAQTLRNLISYCIDTLPKAEAAPRQRAHFDELAAQLADLREHATPTGWDFSHMYRLRGAIVIAAFLRPGYDEPEPENPLYSVLAWLADAMGHAGALARLRVTCASVAGITEA